MRCPIPISASEKSRSNNALQIPLVASMSMPESSMRQSLNPSSINWGDKLTRSLAVLAFKAIFFKSRYTSLFDGRVANRRTRLLVMHKFDFLFRVYLAQFSSQSSTSKITYWWNLLHSFSFLVSRSTTSRQRLEMRRSVLFCGTCAKMQEMHSMLSESKEALLVLQSGGEIILMFTRKLAGNKTLHLLLNNSFTFSRGKSKL